MQSMIALIEYSLGRRHLERIYDNVIAATDQGESYWRAALQELDACPTFQETAFQQIPKNGPVVFIANHPFGILDGLTLCHLAECSRGHFHILINAALCREPRLEPYFMPVDSDAETELQEEDTITLGMSDSISLSETKSFTTFTSEGEVPH